MNNKVDLGNIDVKTLLNNPDHYSQDPSNDPTPGNDPGNDNDDPSQDPTQKPANEDPNQDPAQDPNNDPVDDPSDDPNGDPNGDTDEDDIFSQLGQNLGFMPEGTYEDSIEGMTNFTRDAALAMANQTMEGYFQKYPKAQEFIQYLENGGDPERYHQVNRIDDIETIEITDDNIRVQRDLVKGMLVEMGYSPEDIPAMLDEYEDNEMLKTHATKALNTLKVKKANERAALIESQRLEAIAEAERQENTWNEISSIIKEGSLNGIKIPETEKKGFFEWMAKPVDKDGNSQRTLARQQLDQASMLTLEYLIYKGLDFSKLIQASKTTKQAQSLSKRFKTPGTPQRMGGNKPNSGGASKIPGFKEIFGK